ncbi:MgtC/SapB family protein [Microbacterium laevaniformans]|uniref:MgtC/SapB family protein n=1 Tax=Microbacterium laevaniformans TaxID=36807 RepID=UPI00195B5F1B|nr:MgtC/SapB family protein [Microbacterium laevaniformans]MBM7754008.1 putative Mg2+ transporter-C (MgtC) family protein [Microbacterium laevaniformans]GLJ65774.1 methyltransferase [Microbacterium laevaniformans]
MTLTNLDFILRLLLAGGCGMLIGLERQYRSRTAGLRTQALVALGAAAFVLYGIQVGVPQASLQITAYVVSGVGFLGGGVILRQGFTVQGLNTAATLWCSAAVGCQAAGGHVIPALATTGLVLAIHLLLRPLGRLVDRAPAAKSETVGAYRLTVRVLERREAELRARLSAALDSPDVVVHGMTSHLDDSGGKGQEIEELEAELLVEGHAATLLDGIVTRLSLEPGVRGLSWRSEDPAPIGDDEGNGRPTHGSALRAITRRTRDE